MPGAKGSAPSASQAAAAIDDQDIYDDGEYRKFGVSKGKQTNQLLMRRPLGRARASTHQLPPAGYCFGNVEKPNDEGNCLQWDLPKSAAGSQRDLVGVSRSALLAKKGPLPYNADTVFGVHSSLSTPITSIITNQYQRDYLQKQREARAHEAATISLAEAARQHGRLKPALPTAASKGHAAVNKPMEVKEPFKMRRFQNIPSRVRLQNHSHLSAAAPGASGGQEGAQAAAGGAPVSE